LRSHNVVECISRTSTYLSCGEKATFQKSKSLPSAEGLTHLAERRESHRLDTAAECAHEAANSEARNLLVPWPRTWGRISRAVSRRTKEFND
jgi:hypothetical protein